MNGDQSDDRAENLGYGGEVRGPAEVEVVEGAEDKEAGVLADCRSGMGQREVGEKWGMSQADVSRVALRGGLRRHRRALDDGQVRRVLELRAGGMGWKENAREVGCSKQVAWLAGRRAGRALDGA